MRGRYRPPAGPAAAAGAGAAAGAAGRRPGVGDSEPGLLTHAELHHGYGDDHRGYGDDHDDYDDEQAGFNEFGPDDDEDTPDEGEKGKKGKAALTPKQRKKRRWKIIRRTIYALFGLFVVLPAIAFTIAYFLVDVPTPDEVLAQQSQVVTYYYSDGSVMGKEVPDGQNRQLLKPGQITDTVKHAVYAAEDATFETNNGFDITGILGAVYNNLTGGSGGGSTISQQYIKKATENEAPTLTRKATELVKSFKMNQTQSKEDIITAYLNIVYFGRGAYGIEAAAHAYFGKSAAELNQSEAALLAGLIQGPGKSENAEYTTWRWNYVMDNMVKYNWLPQAERQAAQYPTPLPKDQTKPQAITGNNAFIQGQVESELDAAGYSKEKLQANGYNVYTTIDPNAQRLAEKAVNDYMQGQPDTLKKALVAVDPKTRGVIAYYGGPNDKTDYIDWANTARNPGSSFKTFDLVAFLKMGKGLGETFDGSTHRQFGVLPNGNPRYINNAGASNSCSDKCTVAEATMRSTNTVFFDMVANVTGPQAVADAAKEAGVTSLKAVDNNIALGGGSTAATPLDMATGYATIADNGTYLDRHFVQKVTDSSGEVVYQPSSNPKPAFAEGDANKSKQIAGNVTNALKPVIGFSKLSCPSGHECAGKTGTQQYDASAGNGSGSEKDNSQVWMVGYTPSISAASWVGSDKNTPLRDKNGDPVSSTGLPAKIWQQFMNDYLKGKPSEKFPSVSPIGKTATAADDSSSSSRPAPPKTNNPSTPSSPPPSPPPSPPSTESSETSPTRTKPTWSLPNPGDNFGPTTTPGNG
ncbi:transglycosylase domain-containing protein [Amycolatopsis thermophila]|uniref:Membrane peptidoglycan carboxypeptidase n=1 Tax=Amycolatopsis thermophila TaxID=206084 RepID=A0ABU0EU11_9PSEU|nr:transglycosylase domain-containing protein [Amycolatopsis thermophila]MDQ0378277.1 membrane peptidoglycan carboxypeptidase [Amycolatopsis thermophila]